MDGTRRTRTGRHSPGAGGEHEVLRERGVATEELESQSERARRRGQTAVLVALDGKPAGVLAIVDPIKASARSVIEELQVRGIQVVLASGDPYATTRAVAQQLGISEFEAELSPDQKLQLVMRLQSQGAGWLWREMASTTLRLWPRLRSA